MIKKFTLLSGAILALFSCSPSFDLQRGRAENFYQEHPELLAQRCYAAFPVPADSIGEAVVDSVTPAENVDYSEDLDSLQQVAWALQRRIQEDSTICASTYGKQISSLNAAINDLKNRYKKCQSDTANKTRTIYRETVGSVAARAALTADTTSKGRKIAVLQDSEGKAWKEAKRFAKRADLWQIIAFGMIGSWVIFGAVKLFRRF